MSQLSGSPMTQRALPSSIDDLDRAVSQLESTISSLKSQLNPVLDSETLENGCGDVKAAQAPFHYALQISDLVSRLRSLNVTGVDLISRLHV